MSVQVKHPVSDGKTPQLHLLQAQGKRHLDYLLRLRAFLKAVACGLSGSKFSNLSA